ncbi:MAG: hypothetical protein Q7Q71_08085 [Verrucomicrobiota bacterium JB023]|nr:hypothetical protein [Verrucomicrobiota bacterium JB023]
MIKNIFYGLTIVLSGVALFFGMNTKSDLETTVADTETLIEENLVLGDRIEKEEERRKAAEDAKKTAIASRDETKASLDNEQGKENSIKRDLASVEADIEESDAELAEINEAIDEAKITIGEIMGSPVNDIDVDQVVRLIEDLKNERKQKEETLDEKIEQASRLANNVDSAQGEKERLQSRLGSFRRNIALNRVTIAVSSADNDYGFVVLNRGSNNSNIDERSNLIVSRGGRVIGRLKVDSIEPTQTIADIVPDSVKPGQRILPGDKVTISEAASN